MTLTATHAKESAKESAKEAAERAALHSFAASAHTPESFGRALIAQAIGAMADAPGNGFTEGVNHQATLAVRPVGRPATRRRSASTCASDCWAPRSASTSRSPNRSSLCSDRLQPRMVSDSRSLGGGSLTPEPRHRNHRVVRLGRRWCGGRADRAGERNRDEGGE